MQKEKKKQQKQCSSITDEMCSIHEYGKKSKKTTSLETITTMHPALDEQDAEEVKEAIREYLD